MPPRFAVVPEEKAGNSYREEDGKQQPSSGSLAELGDTELRVDTGIWGSAALATAVPRERGRR